MKDPGPEVGTSEGRIDGADDFVAVPGVGAVAVEPATWAREDLPLADRVFEALNQVRQGGGPIGIVDVLDFVAGRRLPFLGGELGQDRGQERQGFGPVDLARRGRWSSTRGRRGQVGIDCRYERFIMISEKVWRQCDIRRLAGFREV